MNETAMQRDRAVTIFEKSVEGRRAAVLPALDVSRQDPRALLSPLVVEERSRANAGRLLAAGAAAIALAAAVRALTAELAATAFALYVFAWNATAAKKAVAIDPHALIGTGLLCALGSGILSLFGGHAFLTGLWAKLPVSEQSGLALGTPVVFDVGVYLVVVGSAILIITSLTEEQEERDPC